MVQKLFFLYCRTTRYSRDHYAPPLHSHSEHLLTIGQVQLRMSWNGSSEKSAIHHCSKNDCPCKKTTFKSSNRAKGRKIWTKESFCCSPTKLNKNNNNSFDETSFFSNNFQTKFSEMSRVGLEWKMNPLEAANWQFWLQERRFSKTNLSFLFQTNQSKFV